MEYTVLGKTGLKVSRMGLGGIPVQRIDREGTRKLLQAIAAAGINYIDSARAYSVSEEYLGYGLEGIRDKFVLATKSGAKDKETMARDIAISLKNFRTDSIDLYQLHNPDAKGLEQILSPGGALEALQEAKAAGKIGHIGITLHSRELFQKALDMDWVETIMFPYNFVETQAESEIAACKEKNIGFIDMKPLAGGAIEDARLALRFVGKNPAVTIVIPGMAELSELQENLAAAEDKSPWTEAEEAKVEEIRKTLGSQFCRRCNYCAPCTVGIPIPSMFLMEGYLSRYGLADWARGRYEALPQTASACIECGACEPRCPYHLPIRQMLKTVKEKFGK